MILNVILILSVGIGGTYDCTNIVRNPVACGITTLDIDHTAILGKTVEEIAWHKAGIMKNGSIAFADGNIPKVWKLAIKHINILLSFPSCQVLPLILQTDF